MVAITASVLPCRPCTSDMMIQLPYGSCRRTTIAPTVLTIHVHCPISDFRSFLILELTTHGETVEWRCEALPRTSGERLPEWARINSIPQAVPMESREYLQWRWDAMGIASRRRSRGRCGVGVGVGGGVLVGVGSSCSSSRSSSSRGLQEE